MGAVYRNVFLPSKNALEQMRNGAENVTKTQTCKWYFGSISFGIVFQEMERCAWISKCWFFASCEIIWFDDSLLFEKSNKSLVRFGLIQSLTWTNVALMKFQIFIRLKKMKILDRMLTNVVVKDFLSLIKSWLKYFITKLARLQRRI